MIKRRLCISCGFTLSRRRGHGFVTPDGKGVKCSTCMFPPKPKRRKKELIYEG